MTMASKDTSAAVAILKKFRQDASEALGALRGSGLQGLPEEYKKAEATLERLILDLSEVKDKGESH